MGFTLQVKRVDGTVISVDVESSMSIEDLKTVLSRRSDIPKNNQRLVYNGKNLQDDQSLASYGLGDQATVHLIRSSLQGGRSNADARGSIGGLPPSLGQFQSHLVRNPEVMEQMLNTSAMQSLLSNPELLKSLILMNPQLQQLMDQNPELKRMVEDTNFLQRAGEMFQNPSMMREMMRNTDRAISNIETIPGGFDALKRLYTDVQGPAWEAALGMAGGPAKAEQRGGYSNKDGGRPQGDPMPNAFDSSRNQAPAPSSGPPGWARAFEPNAMAAMMQDPNMQHLMSSMFNTMQQSKPQAGAQPGQSPLQPFTNANTLSHMFQSTTMQAMNQMESSMQQLRNTTLSGGAQGGSSVPAGVEMSGLNPQSPAANFGVSFQNFLRAQQENPEMMYAL